MMDGNTTSGPTKKLGGWKEIADLPEDLDRLCDSELESLGEVWAREKERIGEDNRILEFNAQLAREWAIETGILEDIYTLDRDITQALIERGIDSGYIPHDATNRDPEWWRESFRPMSMFWKVSFHL